jgi:Putative GTPase activating protein for Arf
MMRIHLYSIDDSDKGVKFISVNNAVLVCEECAVEHRKLPSGLSYIMSIVDAGETYSLQKVELLKFGGNDRFRTFCDSFTQEDSKESSLSEMPIPKKYATNAVKYYRHKI